MDYDREDLKMLTEIAFSATARGYFDTAKPIYDALAILRPDNAASDVGYALGAIIQGDNASAIDRLRSDAIMKKESADEARAVLMIALQLEGRTAEVEQLRHELMNKGGSAKGIAEMFVAQAS